MPKPLKFFQAIDLNGNRIISAGDATAPDDLVTLQQLENAISGLDSGISFEGGIDPSITDTGSASYWVNVVFADKGFIRTGDMYQIIADGDMEVLSGDGEGGVDSVSVIVGDLIFFNREIQDYEDIRAGDIVIIDNNDAEELLKVDEIDGVTIESFMDGEDRKFRIKNLGVTAAKINEDVAGEGLVKNEANGALDVNAGTGIEVDDNEVRVKDIDTTHFAENIIDSDVGAFDGEDDDSLASTKAIKAYVDANSGDIQDELDDTQVGAGLENDGSYDANGDANYISEATSLKDADNLLDSALKTEEEAREAADTALQNELNDTQAGAGLEDNGDYEAFEAFDGENDGVHFIDGATSLKDADKKLDSALKDEEDARIAADDALDTRIDDEIQDRIDGDQDIRDDLASNANGEGASLIGIEDAESGFEASNVEGALAELKVDIEDAKGDITMQGVYNNSDPVGGIVEIKLEKDKAIKFMDNDPEDPEGSAGTYFVIDPDDDNPIKVSMTGTVAVSGDMTVSGDLTISGETVQVDSQVTSYDHLALRPAGEAEALFIEADAAFTGETIVDIKSGGNSVLKLDKTNATIEMRKASVSTEFSVEDGASIDMGNNVVTNVADGVNDDEAVNKGQLNSAVSDLDTDISNLQTELDDTQAGAGLENNGNYEANEEANYIDEATSLKNADDKLDSALKAEETARIAADTALQNELNDTQAGAGLENDGSYNAFEAFDGENEGVHFIDEATSLKDADKRLDAKLKEVADAAGSDLDEVQDELNDTQVGAGLEDDGSYEAYGAFDGEEGVHYIDGATNIKDSTKILDNELKDVSDDLDAHVTADSGVHGVTGNVVGTDDEQTLENKTIDVNDNNTISNLTVGNLATGVLDTDLSDVSESDDTIASAKAVVDYVNAFKSVFTVTGDDSTTEFTVEHNRGTEDIIVQVFEVATKEVVLPSIKVIDDNNVQISFVPAPDTGEDFKVVIFG